MLANIMKTYLLPGAYAFCVILLKLYQEIYGHSWNIFQPKI